MYYTVIKHSSHLRTLVFSNACRVLSQCNTRLRLLYLLTINVSRIFREKVYKIKRICFIDVFCFRCMISVYGLINTFARQKQFCTLWKPIIPSLLRSKGYKCYQLLSFGRYLNFQSHLVSSIMSYLVLAKACANEPKWQQRRQQRSHLFWGNILQWNNKKQGNRWIRLFIGVKRPAI